jgi:hypothetical protein
MRRRLGIINTLQGCALIGASATGLQFSWQLITHTVEALTMSGGMLTPAFDNGVRLDSRLPFN